MRPFFVSLWFLIMSPYLRTPVLRACAKITWRNARSGSDQCSIPDAQFLSEQREAARVRHPLRLRIAHWELNIGQILGLMRSSGSRACVSAPLPLRGRPPFQGGHYTLPPCEAKGESRRRRQGPLTHARTSVTLRTTVLSHRVTADA